MAYEFLTASASYYVFVSSCPNKPYTIVSWYSLSRISIQELCHCARSYAAFWHITATSHTTPYTKNGAYRKRSTAQSVANTITRRNVAPSVFLLCFCYEVIAPIAIVKVDSKRRSSFLNQFHCSIKSFNKKDPS